MSTLSVVAVLLGVLFCRLLVQSEVKLAEEQFLSIASRGTLAASRIVERKLRGTSVLSSVIANAHPDPDEWPFVTLTGFEETTRALLESTDGHGMGLIPFVEPNLLADFEDFAYNFFSTTRTPEPFPINTGTSSFGRGIWGVDDELDSSDRRYHDNTVERDYDSPNDFFAPVLQHSDGPSSVLMLNVRYEEKRGKAIDAMVSCAKEGLSSSCAEITDVVSLVGSEAASSPGAILLNPIQPVGGSNVTGAIASTLVWEELFENVFSDEVSGIICVLESQHIHHTYMVDKGRASLVEGAVHSFHDRYRQYRVSTTLTSEKLFDEKSPQYVLSLYPSKRFFEVYSTRNPQLAAVATFVAIALTSLLFVLYDYFVQTESFNKSELLEAKRQFMRWVCHELRTPLNSLRLGLSIVCTELQNRVQEQKHERSEEDICTITDYEVSDWHQLTTELQESANIAVDVLSDLLNYDRLESGNLSLQLSVFHLSTLLQETASEFCMLAQGKNIDFNLSTFDCGSASLTCGDRVRLGQVFRNVFSNAINFTPNGGSVILSIDIQKFSLPRSQQTFILQNEKLVPMNQVGNCIVKVKDSGPGMTKDQTKSIFRDGVQFNVNSLRQQNRSGLGLYISKGLIEQHNGSISMESSGPGMGATVVVTVPLFNSTEASQTTSVSESLAASSLQTPPKGDTTDTDQWKMDSETSDRGLHILVVDDSASNRKLLIRLLKKLGHRCEAAEDGSVAVQLVRNALDSDPYDCILLDFEMPIQNGPSAAQEIRSFGCETCIIGITGNVLAEDVDYFQKMGANEVLPKPLHLPDLESLLVDFRLTSSMSSLMIQNSPSSDPNAT